MGHLLQELAVLPPPQKGEFFLLAVGVFLLAVELLCLQSVSRKLPIVSKNQRTPWGVEKRGGRKTSRMTPLSKMGFGHPSYGTKNPRLSRPEALLEGSRIFREGAFSDTFSLPPYVFAPPPYHGPKKSCIPSKVAFRLVMCVSHRFWVPLLEGRKVSLQSLLNLSPFRSCCWVVLPHF